MTPKFTDGPWCLRSEGTSTMCVVSGGSRYVIDRFPQPAGMTDAERVANARLAAAGPELFRTFADLAWAADAVELMLRERHPGEAASLGAKVAAAKAALELAVRGSGP